MGSGNKCGASCFILANLDAGPAAVLTCSRVLAGRLFTLTQHILDCLRRSTRRALFTGHNKALRSGLADLTCSLAVDSIFFFTISDYAAAIIQIVGCYLHCNFTGTAAPQDYSLAMKKKIGVRASCRSSIKLIRQNTIRCHHACSLYVSNR
jgi:hypothetical protein